MADSINRLKLIYDLITEDHPNTDYEDFVVIPPDPALAKERRQNLRAMTTGAALLTTEEAAQRLPGRAAVNRRWLKQRVDCLRLPNGQEVYQWADVLRSLERVQ